MVRLFTALAVLFPLSNAAADLCDKVERKPNGGVALEEIKDAAGNRGVRACIYMDSTTEQVYATLVDYPSFTKWMDKMETINPVWLDEKTALVEYSIGTLFGDYTYTLRRTHEKNRRIAWNREKGDFKLIAGQYTFIPIPGGPGSLFVSETYLDPGKPAPAFILSYFQEKGTTRLLKDIREETRKRRKK
jgi:uncharacterized membrane protein